MVKATLNGHYEAQSELVVVIVPSSEISVPAFANNPEDVVIYEDEYLEYSLPAFSETN